MMPPGQKKRQLRAFIDKIDLGRRRLLISDRTDPVLFEKQEVESQMDDIAGEAAVETDNLDGRERRAELVEQGSVETSPNRFQRLRNRCF